MAAIPDEITAGPASVISYLPAGSQQHVLTYKLGKCKMTMTYLNHEE